MSNLREIITAIQAATIVGGLYVATILLAVLVASLARDPGRRQDAIRALKFLMRQKTNRRGR
jgi:hypothetical protein